MATIMQPAEFMAQLKLDVKEPERVIDAVLSYLHWMPNGSVLSTNVFTFNKIDPNTIYIESDVSRDDLVNVLAGTDIKIPI